MLHLCTYIIIMPEIGVKDATSLCLVPSLLFTTSAAFTISCMQGAKDIN